MGRRGKKGSKDRERQRRKATTLDPIEKKVCDGRSGKTYKWTEPPKIKRGPIFNSWGSPAWQPIPHARSRSPQRSRRLKEPPGQFKEATSQLPNLDTPIIIDIVVPTTEQWETKAIRIPIDKFIL